MFEEMICVIKLLERQEKTLMFWLVYAIYIKSILQEVELNVSHLQVLQKNSSSLQSEILRKEIFLMKNVEMTVEGETLIIKVDLSKDFGPSKSGKTIIVASTEGNVSVLGRDEKIGLNVYRKPD